MSYQLSSFTTTHHALPFDQPHLDFPSSSSQQPSLQKNHLSVLNKRLPPTPSSRSFDPSELTTVLVGSKQRPFQVHRRLLCDACPSFAQQLPEYMPNTADAEPVTLWLPQESATMFALFVEWLHDKPFFKVHLDESVRKASERGVPKLLLDIHWTMVRLHLFASRLQLHQLQDLLMDTIQDLYLKRDWDVAPNLVEFLYRQCEALPSVRLRRWAVAMVAFRLTVSYHNTPLNDVVDCDAAEFRRLFHQLPEFTTDYARHLRNMRAAGLDVRFKNPQLRIGANRLGSEERSFGFRQCSFHSHRKTIGQARCLHQVADANTGETRVVSAIYDMGRSPRPPQNNHYYQRQEYQETDCLDPPPGIFPSRPWMSPGASVPSTVED